MLDVEVIEDAPTAAVALDPIRAHLLAELAEPASAAILATRLGISRQKVNYHLRALELHGLVELAEERKWGGITERVLRVDGRGYVVSPAALDDAGADPGADRRPPLRALPRRPRRADRPRGRRAVPPRVRRRAAAPRR